MRTIDYLIPIYFLLSLLTFKAEAQNATYIKGVSLYESVATTVSSASALNLTCNSNTNQGVTGSTAQTVNLPTATGCNLGRVYNITSSDSAAVTVKDAGGTTLATLNNGDSVRLVLLSNGTSAGTWQKYSPATNSWSLSGNAGTTAGTNFLGTTDSTAMVFKTNSTEAMRISSGQLLGILNSSPQAAIHYGAGGTTNNTSGTVGTDAIILGKIASNANIGNGAFVANGYNGANQSVGSDSAVFGFLNTITSPGSFSAGQSNSIGGNANYSIAMGQGATVGFGAFYSVAMGDNPTASGLTSVAIGHNNTATGSYSTALGEGTTAQGYGQTAVGEFNIPQGTSGSRVSTDQVFIVGNGSSNVAQSTAFSVSRDGKTNLYGSTSGILSLIPAASTTSYTLSLPAAQGSNHNSLFNDGSGNLTWGLTNLTNSVTGTLPIGSGGTGQTSFSSGVIHSNGSALSSSAVSLTADVSGVLPIANGGTNNSSAYTAGSLIYSNGTSLTQDNSNAFYDATNKRLGIGTATPSAGIDVHLSGNTVPQLQANNTGTQGSSGGGVIQSIADSGAAMVSGNRLGAFQFGGAQDNADTIYAGATIQAMATENWSGTAGGTSLSFRTTANTTHTKSQALLLDQNQSATMAGPLTVSNLGTGLVHSSSAGLFTSSAVNLASGDVTGVLPIANGGTNNGSLSVTAGSAYYADGTKLVALAPGTSGQVYTSGGSGAPTWSTVLTNPMTTTGDIIYSSNNSGTPARLGVGTAPAYLGVSSGLPAWQSLKAPTVSLVNGSTFSGGFNGSGTYTTPAGVLYITVTLMGGGGGGGSSGNTGTSNGTAGGSTTFGTSLLSGGGGSAGARGAGGGGGGSITINSPALDIGSFVGSTGNGYQFNNATNASEAGGSGGNSCFGAGGGSAGSGGGGNPGIAATPHTGGGGGGAGVGTGTANYSSGSGGGAGGCVRALIQSPSSSYSYSLGAGGTADTAGNGFAGGAGADGTIVVTEYYQ